MQITKVPMTWNRVTKNNDLMNYAINLSEFMATKHFEEKECAGSIGLLRSNENVLNKEIENITKYLNNGNN